MAVFKCSSKCLQKNIHAVTGYHHRCRQRAQNRPYIYYRSRTKRNEELKGLKKHLSPSPGYILGLNVLIFRLYHRHTYIWESNRCTCSSFGINSLDWILLLNATNATNKTFFEAEITNRTADNIHVPPNHGLRGCPDEMFITVQEPHSITAEGLFCRQLRATNKWTKPFLQSPTTMSLKNPWLQGDYMAPISCWLNQWPRRNGNHYPIEHKWCHLLCARSIFAALL